MSDTEVHNMTQYDAYKKSVGIAYLFWFFFGLFGGHRFYLQKKGTGAAILTITIMSLFLMFVSAIFMDESSLMDNSSSQTDDPFAVSFGFGFITFLISTIWVLVDAFYLPQIVRIYNENLAAWLKG